MSEERYRPFVFSAVIGCILWLTSGGIIHAYVISPDWEVMGEGSIVALSGLRPLLMLAIIGFSLGLFVQIAAIIGAVFESEGMCLFLPMIVGFMIGVFQGHLVTSELWGFASNTVFRSDVVRLLAGGMCGFVITVPTILIGIAVRRRSLPW